MISESIPNNVGSSLEKLGWRQGSIISSSDLKIILARWNSDLKICGDIAIVTTQSCDIANNRLTDEPYIEVIIGQIVDKISDNYTFNKHPRILHLILKKRTGDENIFEDINVHVPAFQKIQIPKCIFLNLALSSELFLIDRELESFISWLAARYARPALPTVFNDRIEETDRKQKRRKIAKQLDVALTGLYIEIIPDAEINEDENYSVNLLGLVYADYEGDLNKVELLVNDIATIMKAANMDVVCKVLREDQLSVAVLRRFKRFYYDDLSLRNNNELPPEVELLL